MTPFLKGMEEEEEEEDAGEGGETPVGDRGEAEQEGSEFNFTSPMVTQGWEPQRRRAEETSWKRSQRQPAET